MDSQFLGLAPTSDEVAAVGPFDSGEMVPWELPVLPLELGRDCGWGRMGCAEGLFPVDDAAKYGGTTAVFLAVTEGLLGRGTKVGMRVGMEGRGTAVVEERGGTVVEEKGEAVGEEAELKGETVLVEPIERLKSFAAMGLRRGKGLGGWAVEAEETPCVDV